jgi:AraC-like DNA-binding protein
MLVVRFERFTDWHHADLAAPYWRLYWNAQVGASVRLFARVTRLSPRQIYLIPPETPFASSNEGPVDHLYLHFQAYPPYDRGEPAVHELGAPRAVLSTAAELARRLTRGTESPRNALLALSLVHWALIRLPEELIEASRCDERVAAVAAHVQAHLSDPLTNEELAKVAKMSTNAFIRFFHRTAGLSPQSFVRARRVEHAGVLLHNSTQKIEEIATATGFCDRYHFSRIFKRVRGMGPAEFRRRATYGSKR